jgi:DDE superfamily endonuclease
MTQLPSEKPDLFKGRHFNHLLIIRAVRWYVTYKLSYRDVCDLMAERGVTVVHTTVLRWVQRFVPAFEKKWKNYARPVGSSWRVDETYIKVQGQGRYLYRAVDKQGQTVAFLLTKNRDRFADYRRAFFAFRPSALGMRLFPCQDLDPMRGQMSGVFKFAYCRAAQRFEEFHDKLSLPAFDAGFDFIDFPQHGHIVRRFEFAFQSAAFDPDTVKMNSLLRSDFRQILQCLFNSRALRQPEKQARAVSSHRARRCSAL